MSAPAPIAAEPSVQLVEARPEYVSELGRICYEAFKDIQERHHAPVDFPSAAVARQIIGMLVARKDFYGVTALVNGQPVGSNFLSLTDEVAGVGPITVDCSMQNRSVGRLLMHDVIAYARRNNIARVRLLQEAFHMRALTLYASLGFDVQHAVAYMQAVPAAERDSNIREVIRTDLDAIEQLSRRIYKCSRRNEVSAAAPHGFLALVRERQGRITGYHIPGPFGHGVAETEEDAVALIGEAARSVPAPMAKFLCPLDEGGFYRAVLKAGCRALKMFTLMTLGPYERPGEVWMPSVWY
jgi:predicted N-acetyltransferase YhbS